MGSKLPLLLSFGLVSACSTTGFPLAERAASENLAHQRVRTPFFEHSIYRKEDTSAYQVVFIEGDGRPWNTDGSVPSRDPTPRDALAFDLLLATPADAYYVTRPCYFETWNEACSAEVWTEARFSRSVVTSLAQATRAATDPDRPMILVGYSGGGALAVLVAPELENVAGVVSIAGLLDTDRWTSHHGYEPLLGSINPVARTPDIPQLHLHGATDTVVPIEHVRDAVALWSDARLRTFDEYGHVCCWRRDWVTIWRQVEIAFELDVYEQSDSTRASQ